MAYSLSAREQRVRNLLTADGTPSPKFPLFLHCTEGLIISSAYYTLDYALSSGIEPGWWYQVQYTDRNGSIQHGEYFEDQIEILN